MPGRKPFEAVKNYLDPIRDCVAVLGHPTLILAKGQKYEVGAEGYWRLGAEDGLQLRMTNGSTAYFEAEQAFRIVEIEPERRTGSDRYRVTTLMYAYQLKIDGIVEWQMHWHPQGNSYETRPHYHFNRKPGAHNPCARHTIEDAIEWCVVEGAVPTTEGWPSILHASKQVHEDHRSWHDQPLESTT
ncbi:hypothetical protein HYG77_09855 [Rhodococcus sp. ZPP]|uniref:hypothetical protein n=1 Tax=Rhodococcus sp. ZPP TaxID=2749906 RepID=UPI001AD850FF|nr:hypothetical protein [Rhodococcus sp. ZPP]QTJ65868.1 hypothetical protein HYG77_09855 [Rhodococcus sp. ZPP]